MSVRSVFPRRAVFQSATPADRTSLLYWCDDAERCWRREPGRRERASLSSPGRRHVRRCAVLEEGPELGAMGGCVICAATGGRGTRGASRWFAGLLTGIIIYLASSQQKQQIIEQNGGRRAFERAHQSFTHPPKRSALRWFRSRANLGSETLPRTGAGSRGCASKWRIWSNSQQPPFFY